MKAFSIGCVVTTAALFLLLEIFFQPTPLLTSVLSLFAAILMAASIRASVKRIYEKETHVNDKGWTGKKEPVIQETGTVTKIRKKTSDSNGLEIILLVGVFAISILRNTDVMQMKLIGRIASVVGLVFLLFTVAKILNWQKSIPQKQPVLAIIPVLGAAILNAAIIFISPVNDFWYYLGDAVCILILIISSVFMLQVYNIGTTRPLPRLFDREEVQ
jgi:hypothetical protein